MVFLAIVTVLRCWAGEGSDLPTLAEAQPRYTDAYTDRKACPPTPDQPLHDPHLKWPNKPLNRAANSSLQSTHGTIRQQALLPQG